VDQEVSKTLGELESKLQELERELTSLGHSGTRPARSVAQPQPQDWRAEPTNVPGRLVDEAVESDDGTAQRDGDVQSDIEARVEETAVDNAFGGPGVWGGEEVPAQAGSTIERDWTVEVRETAYGEIPTPPSPPDGDSRAPHTSPWPSRHEPPLPPPLPQPHHPYASTPPEREMIDVGDLMRFKEKMQHTLDELIDEYSRLLSLHRPS
jgi:hypothetical protein